MLQVVVSLIILGFCSNGCFSATPVPSSQENAFTTSWLNSSATKVYTAANATDAANWNPANASTNIDWYCTTGVRWYDVIFGPGFTNDTSYVYGVITSYNNSQLIQIIKRTLNNTIVGWGNDTSRSSVATSDSAITTTIIALGAFYRSATGPSYLALLTQGSDGTNYQVYVTLLAGTSLNTVKITSTLDIVAATSTTSQGCTITTYDIGNIWYDEGAGAFFTLIGST